MKDIKYLAIALLLLLFNIPFAYAECTNEKIEIIKEETDKIEITYKHLGEVTKEDGSKVYNEFMVTAKNIPENVYIHLSPMTEENFIEEENQTKIKLTSGKWYYSLYSSECEREIDTIEVKLPTFNMYSIDPLCEGIDGNDFKLCGKYYESHVSRDIFEKKVKDYRKRHVVINNDNIDEKNIKENKIINFIINNRIYLIGTAGILIIIGIIIISIKKINKRKIL